MSQNKKAALGLTVLYDLGLYIGACDDPLEILSGIIDHLRAIMPIEFAWLLTRDGDLFKEVAVLGPCGQTVLPGTRRVDSTIIEAIVMQEFDGLIEDLARLGPLREDEFFPARARSAVVSPVQRGREAEACLIVASSRPAAYNREQALLLFMLALQLGVVLKNANLRSRLKRDEASRRDLTAMLIHDLRSPLGVINWNLEQLLEGLEGLTPEQGEFIESSIETTQELLELVDSLLDIDRLESNSLPLDFEEIDLKPLVERVVKRMRFASQPLGLEFEIKAEGELTSLWGDPQLIRRVLFNLLFNATKYSPRKGLIRIELSQESGWVRLAVEDQGQGIPEDQLERIFDKYSQLEARDQGPIRSKGLGLTFCRLAVEAHGGSIRAQNAQGARFEFVLPLKKPDQAPG